MGLQRVGHDWATSLHFTSSCLVQVFLRVSLELVNLQETDNLEIYHQIPISTLQSSSYKLVIPSIACEDDLWDDKPAAANDICFFSPAMQTADNKWIKSSQIVFPNCKWGKVITNGSRISPLVIQNYFNSFHWQVSTVCCSFIKN